MPKRAELILPAPSDILMISLFSNWQNKNIYQDFQTLVFNLK